MESWRSRICWTATEGVTLPARACDGDAVGAFLDGLSFQSRYLRFHGAASGASPLLRKLLCDVDGALHQAWLAWVGEGDDARVVGEARFVMTAPDSEAELAIVVADAYQGSGLAQALMQQLLGAATSAGVSAPRWSERKIRRQATVRPSRPR